MRNRLLYTLIGIMSVCHVMAQHTLSGVVRDAHDKEPLVFATLRLFAEDNTWQGTVSDAEGKYSFAPLHKGKYRLIVSYVGYDTFTQQILIDGDRQLSFSLQPQNMNLGEVVVTASESKGVTSASKIDRTGMEHLQPTSFTDLLSLLPGKTSQTPRMGSANIIRLREPINAAANYNTSSLGTQFIIDGTPISTDADMQKVSSDLNTLLANRNAVNAGVDMRQLGTDNIESVEIIRGIPSVEYADLTSGLVIVHRKLGDTPLEARFKSDQYAKLFALGKGISWKEKALTLYGDLSYLDSKTDPRNTLDNYRRISTSLRMEKEWFPADEHRLRYTSAMDYSGNIDRSKSDPDIQTMPEDNYTSAYHSAGWTHRFRWTTPSTWTLRSVEANLSAKMSWDKIERSKLVALDRDRLTPVNTEEGEYDAVILPYRYVAHQTVDGRPLNLYAHLKARFRFRTKSILHNVQSGFNWRLNKNYGDGQVYDPSRPLNPTNTTRPRRYIDIPASVQYSFYIEDKLGLPLGNHYIEAEAGIVGNMSGNLDSRYEISGKIYPDIRTNLSWRLPAVRWGNRDLRFSLSGGVGQLTKMPTLQHLYPEKVYDDRVQLNYWHANPAYKRIHIKTHVIDPTNYALKPARNFKWELRLGAEYGKNSLFITYFRERMQSGFRSLTQAYPVKFKVYDTSGIDASALTAPPALEDLTFRNDTVLDKYGMYGNGSSTRKEGIEFQFASERFPHINTRVTINGAWLRSIYSNSFPLIDTGSSPVINNVSVSDKYLGVYEETERYIREQFNTNFIFDTYMDKLGLKFSTTFECMWFLASKTDPQSTKPIAYMDVSGKLQPYTTADEQDIYKRHLLRPTNPLAYMKRTTPFSMFINFKATKDFGRNVSLSLFANQIIDYTPDYTFNGTLVRRTSPEAYFGMEFNLKL